MKLSFHLKVMVCSWFIGLEKSLATHGVSSSRLGTKKVKENEKKTKEHSEKNHQNKNWKIGNLFEVPAQ